LSRVISVRSALPEDAASACDVLRRSIRELCVLDHRNDEEVISAWLENKTLDNVRRWIESQTTYSVVAECERSVCGFAMMSRTGVVSLCYVAPAMHRSGAGKKMLAALEVQARQWQLQSIQLESTVTAKPFYERSGYVSFGPVVEVRGAQGGYPMKKLLTTTPHE
jgi:N-acetylglutamate synthase-like GNAT family acetyltransferase